ncbi:class I SAM-dependent methyltransferase [Candidatus Bathyarchaeota archaeon]|nr:class I SAM-dependent methyltransferase [Candidatus Bathyarchaeota archaeon]
MNQIYGNAPLEKIPWNIQDPPSFLVRVVESGKVTPCRTVDIGCGVGNYAVWLASKGFQVTGIDVSEKAIEIARDQAQQKGVDCEFLVGDLVSPDFEPEGVFQFAYDWEVLHHVFPEERGIYIDNIRKMLEPGGIYFSVCFSEQDSDFGGEGKYRQTPMNTTLYFSSEEEIRNQLATGFYIKELHTIEIAGKYGPHIAVMVLAVKI